MIFAGTNKQSLPLQKQPGYSTSLEDMFTTVLHPQEKLYLTLVRPHLEYAAASWDPYTKKNIDSIERVQKRAARFVVNTYGKDTSISTILKELRGSHFRKALSVTG